MQVHSPHFGSPLVGLIGLLESSLSLGWMFRSSGMYTFGGSSLAEIHGTQDEPRVGITFWEQFVTPFSMPEEGYDTALA